MKVIRNVFAGGGYQASVALSQLLVIPCFVSMWGAEAYGLWVANVALLVLLGYADFGFLSVCAYLINRSSSISIASKFFFSGHIFLLLGFVVFGVCFNIFGHFFFDNYPLGACLVYSSYFFFQALVTFVSNSSRTSMKYAEYLLLNTSFKLLELLVVAATLIAGAGEWGVAVSYLLVSICNYVVLLFKFRRDRGGLYIGLSVVRLFRWGRKRALSAFTFPASLTLWLQLSVVVLSRSLTGSELALFSTIRTLTRLVVQSTNVLNSAFWGRMVVSYREDITGFVQDSNLSLKLSAMSILVFFVMMSLGGEWGYTAWTGLAILDNETMFILLLCASCLSAFWLSLVFPMMVANEYSKFSMFYLCLVVSSLGCVFLLGEYSYRNVDALWLFLSLEFVMLVYALIRRRSFFLEVRNG